MNEQIEKDSFKESYNLCKDYCISKLHRITHNLQDSEDVFAEAISIYWIKSKQGKIKNEKNIPAYVFTIAKNLYFTKKKSTLITEDLSSLNSNLFKTEENWSHSSIDKELIEKLRICLNELNEGCQQLLKYKYVYKYTYEEMAQKMQRNSSDSLKTQTFRCLNKLKEIMQHKTYNL